MTIHRPPTAVCASLLLVALSFACSPADNASSPSSDAPWAEFPCDPDNGGIDLPEGFCGTVFADELGVARHLAVKANGDVYVARAPIRRRGEDGDIVVDSPGGVVALRDTDGDGKADLVEELDPIAGTGLAIHDGHLYYSTATEIYRVELSDDLLPAAAPELLVSGFPSQSQHASKPMTFDGAGNMYVTVGGPSNACQQDMRTPGSPGRDPCPQLQWHGGIWRFDASRPGQTHQGDGHRYATGIRNGLALDWNPQVDALFAIQHGRDSLSQLFPDQYSNQVSAELPAEEVFRVGEGDDFGWPYCYYDPAQQKKVLAPEYGGDGETVGRCAEVAPTLFAFPAHWAPNDLLFYRDSRFGAHYENGAFIAFHGSWNRGPFEQQGYKVVFLPFADGIPSGSAENFAVGFPQVQEVRTPGDAVYRPTGLAQGPDGSLYIADSRRGRIWRVRVEAQSTADEPPR